MESASVIVSLVVLLLPLASDSVSYDPNIECDLSELIWEYAKKLMPSRGTFSSVYDAVNLDKCNVSKHAVSNPAKNLRKKRYSVGDGLMCIVIDSIIDLYIRVYTY